MDRSKLQVPRLCTAPQLSRVTSVRPNTSDVLGMTEQQLGLLPKAFRPRKRESARTFIERQRDLSRTLCYNHLKVNEIQTLKQTEAAQEHQIELDELQLEKRERAFQAN